MARKLTYPLSLRFAQSDFDLLNEYSEKVSNKLKITVYREEVIRSAIREYIKKYSKKHLGKDLTKK